uniref:Si:ch211-191i18.2 n=2 Tax=Astyanax mexicanus TaxID=7994 RepID=A0A3B1JJM4_ASTMX
MLSHGAVFQRHSVEAAHFHTHTHMHTHPLKSNMPRLPHYCLIAVCLAGYMLLHPHCCAGQDDTIYDYDSTPLPEYDYNATFEYTFYSNGSSEDLEKFFNENKIDDEDAVTETNDEDQEPTAPSTSQNQASRTVYPSLLLTVVLTAHQMYRFL